MKIKSFFTEQLQEFIFAFFFTCDIKMSFSLVQQKQTRIKTFSEAKNSCLENVKKLGCCNYLNKLVVVNVKITAKTHFRHYEIQNFLTFFAVHFQMF